MRPAPATDGGGGGPSPDADVAAVRAAAQSCGALTGGPDKVSDLGDRTVGRREHVGHEVAVERRVVHDVPAETARLRRQEEARKDKVAVGVPCSSAAQGRAGANCDLRAYSALPKVEDGLDGTWWKNGKSDVGSHSCGTVITQYLEVRRSGQQPSGPAERPQQRCAARAIHSASSWQSEAAALRCIASCTLE